MTHCQRAVPECLRVASAGGAESIILSAGGAESMMLSVGGVERMMLSDTLSTGLVVYPNRQRRLQKKQQSAILTITD
jgi:hypothetical protein